MVVQQLNSAEEFNKFLLDWKLAVVLFYASWAPPCEQVNKVLKDLQDDYKSYPVDFAFIDAEGIPVLDQRSVVDRVNGYKPSESESKLTQHSFDIASSGAQATNEAAKTAKKRGFEYTTEKFDRDDRLMLFIKGTPDAPRCGFSKQMVGLLNELNADFDPFDILEKKFGGKHVLFLAKVHLDKAQQTNVEHKIDTFSVELRIRRRPSQRLTQSISQ